MGVMKYICPKCSNRYDNPYCTKCNINISKDDWIIEDKEVENPASQTAYTLLQEQLRSVLNTLPSREQEVLKMRFGLDDGYSLTLEEVGLYFDVTRERIRQIEAKALRRLRHPRRANGLRDYVET